MDIVANLLEAISLAREERHAEAEAALRTVIAAEPDQPNALFLLGECALAAGRPAEAVGPLVRNLLIRPSHRDGQIALARAQLAADLAGDALDTLHPVASDAALASAQKLRGTALLALDRPAEATHALALAIAADPQDAEAHLNLGNAHAEMDVPDLAERHIRRAIALDPAMAEAHASLGHLLTAQGRMAEALATTQRAIALQPDMAAAHWNHGVALLLSGDMEAGWEEYEWRKRRFPDSFTTLPAPQWDGGPLDGRRILVLAEQGLGDTIQFARYLPLLARRGAQVAVECAPSLAPLLGTLPGVTAVPWGSRPPHDLWIDQMSLPRVFGTTVATVPAAAGYLRPDPVRFAQWDRLLPPGRRVGLAWAGNPLHSNDRRRSMPAELLAPLLAIEGCVFVSLQLGARAGELPGLADPADRLGDWADTAGLLAALDLVISVDTAVAHLAGALAVPTWLMLPHAPDWRWMLGRDDTPWYAATRLFRQAAPGDWPGVVRQVGSALAEARAWPSRH